MKRHEAVMALKRGERITHPAYATEEQLVKNKVRTGFDPEFIKYIFLRDGVVYSDKGEMGKEWWFWGSKQDVKFDSEWAIYEGSENDNFSIK
jgi:hypothetical protein